MVYEWLDIIQTWLPGCCRRCAQPLAEPGVCGQCRRHPPPFTGSVAPWLYQPPLDALVLQLKTSAAMAPGPLA
jgi:predicted amidophosphoribosyltransferase